MATLGNGSRYAFLPAHLDAILPARFPGGLHHITLIGTAALIHMDVTRHVSLTVGLVQRLKIPAEFSTIRHDPFSPTDGLTGRGSQHLITTANKQ